MPRAGSERDDLEPVSTRPVSSATEFGKYRLIASLGRGGMADVFLAVARGPAGFNKLVVIKRLRSTLHDEAGFVSMFMDEARLAARLNHPNVVHTYEVGENDGSYFMAMEYLEGQPLNRIIRELSKRDQALTLGEAARVAEGALAGLHYAHELKNYDGTPLEIVHRDVSPHNVFVTYEGQVKLVDFGIAKATTRSTQTEVGVLKGKVAYMSPEQAMEANVDRRSDVFAMGIVLWELVARRRLFPFESAAATLNALVNQPIPTLSSAVPDIDAAFEAIVMKALAKEPDARYASALAMREAIEQWMATKTSPVRAEDVGRRVASLFDGVRAATEKQIHEQMVALGDVHDDEPTALERLRKIHGSVPAAPGLLQLGSGSGSGIVPTKPENVADAPIVDGGEEPATRGRARLVLFLALVVFAVSLVGLLFLRVVPSGVAPPATEPARVDPAPPSPPPSAPAPPPVVPQAPPPAPAPDPPPSTNASPPPPLPPAKPTATHASPSKPAAAATTAPVDEPGYLTFDTYPWTRVSTNGRVLGNTPLLHVPLAPGTYTLTLDNPDANIHKTYAVLITSGETTKARLGLE